MSTIIPEKFRLLADLGVIEVSADYDHTKQLGKFKTVRGREFYYLNPDITDKNFPNPSRVLKPGDKLHIRVFQQSVDGTTTSEERLAFLATENAVLTGAQGVSLVFEQKRDQLPKGYWHTSLDERERLWQDAEGDRMVPNMSSDFGGNFGFRLGFFDLPWNVDSTLLCFCDESLGA